MPVRSFEAEPDLELLLEPDYYPCSYYPFSTDNNRICFGATTSYNVIENNFSTNLFNILFHVFNQYSYYLIRVTTRI